ncbi:MAG: DUF58 domain-containing protein [Gemmatimonadales bacterium]|nr:DUF58 domain-containing protein [Gemmatimonadales bacterium]MYG49319.1 DUF58 domain-containing protein [Gemmatimonadales bacterium]MYK01062.1 DUF58 domain-containing protein [Candidatus Palauibacter ramosifaciens]
MVPGRRTWWLLGLTSFVFLFSAAGALAADAVILLLTWIDGRRTRPPSASRTAPRIAALGEVTEIEIELRNPAKRPLSVLLTDDLDHSLRRLPGRDGAEAWEAGVRLDIPPKSVVRARYRVRPRTRGFLAMGAIHLRTRSPWGLAWRRSNVDAAHTLQVQPGIRSLLRDRSGHALRRGLRRAGSRRSRQWGDGREFESLRDYAEGDDPRIVDWKASAKRQRFVVRNYEAERSQNVVLAIDAGRHMRERLADRERVDFALAAGMMLANRARSFGDRVGTVVFDDEIQHLSPPRRSDPAALARIFAGVQTRPVEPNYPLALATLSRTFRKRSLVVLFCDVIDEAVSSALVTSLARIGQAHLPLAVAIRNPALEAAATRSAADEAAVFHRAAAEELVQSRATTLQVMRQSGILVVDTPPGDALVRTLDKYVEIKERGLL